MGTIKVVCGIIYKDDTVLICRRKPEKSLGGFWEFPGGKVDLNESYEESLIRELKEELALEVKIKRPFITHTHQYGENSIELISYICTTSQDKIQSTDHDQIEWIYTINLLDFKLAAADIPIAKALINSEEI